MSFYEPDQGAPDPVDICQSLIRCRSVTPTDAGAQDVIFKYLTPFGFDVHDVTRGDDTGEEIRNSFFSFGNKQTGPHFCFAGHTDVVPPGDETLWSYPPFDAVVENGNIYGRGASDMKGNIAAFMAASCEFIQENGTPKGTISLLITGDEEARAVNGTKKVLEWMDRTDNIPDFCLVGEPSNPEKIGEVLKIGRRGSLSCFLTFKGRQGHVAYPHKADNPIPRMTALLADLTSAPVDNGSEYFPPSSLQVSTVDVGNTAHNVIPAEITATFNVRFNDLWSEETLKAHLKDRFAPYLKNPEDEISWHCHGESFLTTPGPVTSQIAGAITEVTGLTPDMRTDGGTSDARFIHKYCPVIEFGLVNKTIHQTDENVSTESLYTLTKIYKRILEKFFNEQ